MYSPSQRGSRPGGFAASFLAGYALLALLIPVAAFAVLIVWVWLHPARAISWRAATPQSLFYQRWKVARQQAAWDAVHAADLRTAKNSYADATKRFGWNPEFSEAMATRFWNAGRLPEAYVAFHAALYPPPESSGTYIRNSLHWRRYAKLCDAMGRTQEAQEARDKAAALHQSALRAKQDRAAL